MTLASDISTTSTSLSDIKNAIIAKGVTPSGNITTYAAAIADIPIVSSKYGCTIDSLLGNVDSNGVLQAPTDTSGDIVFTGVKDITTYALYYKYSNINLTHGVSFPDLEEVSGNYGMTYAFAFTHISSLSMPKLKIISGVDAFRYCVHSSNINSISLPELETVSSINAMRNFASSSLYLTSLSLPKLKTVTGSYGLANLVNSSTITTLSLPELVTASSNNALYNICSGCSLLETAFFTKLSDISGTATLSYAFQSCPVLTDIYFNGLTTTSFGSNINQFSNMFNSSSMSTSGSCTMHFPSNLQSTISGLTGYPLFGATSGRLTLAYDLPTTS